MKHIPFNLYFGAKIDTGLWYPTIPGERILEGIEDDVLLQVGIYYPDFANSTHREIQLVPKADCKLILRSLDDDITEEEEADIKKMGFSISHVKNYILDETGSDKRIRVTAVAELITYLLKRKFSLGLFSKNNYIINSTKTKE